MVSGKGPHHSMVAMEAEAALDAQRKRKWERRGFSFLFKDTLPMTFVVDIGSTS